MGYRSGTCQSPKIYNEEAITSQKNKTVSKGFVQTVGIVIFEIFLVLVLLVSFNLPFGHPYMPHLPGPAGRACSFQPAL